VMNVFSSTTDEELVVKLRDLAIEEGAPPLVILKLDDLMKTLQSYHGEAYDAGYQDGKEEERAASGSYSEGWEAGYLEGQATAARERKDD
jgi:hypothetical protein